jgi:hypothetical protein
MRFSIARLAAIICLCGVGFAALHSPSYLWANAIFTAALVLLLIAAIRTVFDRGRSRAFATGFLIAGGTYFAACFVPVVREAICVRLVTEPLLDLTYPIVAPTQPPPPPTAASPGMYGGMMGSSGSSAMAMMMMGGMGSTPPAPAPPPSRWSAWTEPDRTVGVGFQIGTVNLVSSEAYRQIGHSLAVIVVGILGGFYARHRFDRSRAAENAASDR